MAIYDTIDLKWAWNGDFELGHDKDLADTSSDGLTSLIQELHTIGASDQGDWEIYERLGSGLADFVGEPNTRQTGEAIHDRIRLAITSFGLVAEEDLDIRVLPINRYKILIVIKVNATPTVNNNLEDSGGLITALVFDFLEQGVTFLEKPPQLLLSDIP